MGAHQPKWHQLHCLPSFFIHCFIRTVNVAVKKKHPTTYIHTFFVGESFTNVDVLTSSSVLYVFEHSFHHWWSPEFTMEQCAFETVLPMQNICLILKCQSLPKPCVFLLLLFFFLSFFSMKGDLLCFSSACFQYCGTLISLDWWFTFHVVMRTSSSFAVCLRCSVSASRSFKVTFFLTGQHL